MENETSKTDKPCTLHSVKPSYLEFNVNGAGKLRISDTDKWKCGGEYGFSIGVEWGRFGFAGGTMPKEEARKMAKHILSVLGD